MSERLNARDVAPGAYQAMDELQRFVDQSALPRTLLELAKMRASQINGWNRLAISFRQEVGTYQSLLRGGWLPSLR